MAREAVRVFNLDRLLFVPVGEPAHRPGANLTPTADRCAMVARAVAEEQRFELSTVDVDRPTRTYSVDTLHDLRVVHGSNADLFFVMGADNLAGALCWHRSEELLLLAHFIASSRRGHPLVDPGFPRGSLSLLRIPRLDISSTQIRALVQSGQSVRHLTPECVAGYINDRGLYARAPATHVSAYMRVGQEALVE